MIPELSLAAIGPTIPVALGAILVPLFSAVLARRSELLGQHLGHARRGTYVAAVSTLFIAASLLASLDAIARPLLEFNPENPMVRMDGFAHFLNAIALISALLTVLGSSKYLAHVHANHGEFYALVLASVTGMMFLSSASDLLMLFLALELMSIPVYALAGFRRTSLRSNESAVKYFLIGSFASGILLYGSSLLYGATGALDLATIGERFDPESSLDVLGAGLVLIGLAFKISSVPFHQWAPDTYEGAPTTVSGFMATAVKVAAFGALLRVVTVALPPLGPSVYGVLGALAVLSMTVGNVMALIQHNTKRMLAYSSIAHAGYVLIGVIVGGVAGTRALLFYLLAYTFMTVGAFTAVAVLARDGQEYENLEDLAGLWQTRPALALILALCMFSLLGMPATAGFVGKFLLFASAVESGIATGNGWLVGLIVIAVLNSAVSLGYYLRVPALMFFYPPREDVAPHVPSWPEWAVLWICAIGVLALGLLPTDALWIWDVNVIQLAGDAAATLAP